MKRNEHKRRTFVGDVFETKRNGKCTVLEYIDKNNVYVKFEDGFVVKCSAGSLRRGSVYVLQLGNVTKVGMTCQDLSKRIDQLNSVSGNSFVEVYSKEFSRDVCFSVEKEMLSMLKLLKYKRPNKVYSGVTECFMDVPLSIVIGMLESFDGSGKYFKS